ncbi:flagellar biosynthesis protein FlhB [Escherichia coli]|uniref:Flagellar biosynthetic protein FlhB n=1 Tax=Escherichia coli TaxID=562 RepID=A0A377B9Z0_ECOLX|nr:flagellar biosynthesis protein FlhB [Escherichia coli]
MVGLCALLVVLGVIPMVGFDVFFQIFSHLKKLRMSRQDIRDEFKQSEGDPHVKGRIRQMQRAAARRRMNGRCAESGCHCPITRPTIR